MWKTDLGHLPLQAVFVAPVSTATFSAHERIESQLRWSGRIWNHVHRRIHAHTDAGMTRSGHSALCFRYQAVLRPTGMLNGEG